jgi:Clp amino terminal domain, pathogenicity island component
VFQRFTEGARQAVIGAQDEARTLGHDAIGPEHLLLGLLHADGIAAEVLTGHAFSIDLETARALVADELGPGRGTPRSAFPSRRRRSEPWRLHRPRWSRGSTTTSTRSTSSSGSSLRCRLLPNASSSACMPIPRGSRLSSQTEFGEVNLESESSRSSGTRSSGAREIALRYAGATPPGRVPDSGDLLLGFFEAGHGIAARALAELGMRFDPLREAVERARREVGRDVRAPKDESGGP